MPNGVTATTTAEGPVWAAMLVERPTVGQVGEHDVGAGQQRGDLRLAAVGHRLLARGQIAEQRPGRPAGRPAAQRIPLPAIRFSPRRRRRRRTSCRSRTPRFRWTTPARASPRTALGLPRSVAQGGGAYPAIAGTSEASAVTCACRANWVIRVHASRSRWLGLAPDVRHHVDVGGLGAQVAGPGVFLGDVPERVE